MNDTINFVDKFLLCVETLLHMLHMLDPVLANLQKVDNLATHINLITTFTTIIPNTGPRVL